MSYALFLDGNYIGKTGVITW